MVNRVWYHHFGTGLVKTLENFGAKGELPSHPELLDWLAVNFVQRGWSIKDLHRAIHEFPHVPPVKPRHGRNAETRSWESTAFANESATNGCRSAS